LSVVAADGFPGYKTDDDNLHEAGFDAFVTGVSFIGMALAIGKLEQISLTG
jgi:poly(A)-specific ribonuclease